MSVLSPVFFNAHSQNNLQTYSSKPRFGAIYTVEAPNIDIFHRKLWERQKQGRIATFLQAIRLLAPQSTEVHGKTISRIFALLESIQPSRIYQVPWRTTDRGIIIRACKIPDRDFADARHVENMIGDLEHPRYPELRFIPEQNLTQEKVPVDLTDAVHKGAFAALSTRTGTFGFRHNDEGVVKLYTAEDTAPFLDEQTDAMLPGTHIFILNKPSSETSNPPSPMDT